MSWRRLLKFLTTPIVVVVALLYFLLDALFLAIVKPIVSRLSRLPIFERMWVWVDRLGPYPTLALFLVPVIILEPFKPIGFYYIAEGHLVTGVAVLAIGEILKLTIVERLFHRSKPKLMAIPLFAWGFNFVMKWLARLKALSAWQWAMARISQIKAAIRELFAAHRTR